MKTKSGGRKNLLQQLFAMMLALVLAVADVPAAGLGGVFALGTVHAEGALTITVPEKYASIPETKVTEPIDTFDASAWVSGGAAPYIFEKVSGPDWIWVLESGVVTGVPVKEAETNADLVIRVTDSEGESATAAIPVGKNPPLWQQPNSVTHQNYSSMQTVDNVVVDTDHAYRIGTVGIPSGHMLGYDSDTANYWGSEGPIFSHSTTPSFYWTNSNGVSGAGESNYNAKFDWERGTLTLRNYDGRGIAFGGPYVKEIDDGVNGSYGNGILYLKGDNTVTVDNSETGKRNAVGIVTGRKGNLVITGDDGATLTIRVKTERVEKVGDDYGNISGIHTGIDYSPGANVEVVDKVGKVIVCGNVTVNIEVVSEEYLSEGFISGICAAEGVYVLQGASLNVSAAADYPFSPGLVMAVYASGSGVAKKDLTVATSGRVKLRAKNSDGANSSTNWTYATGPVQLYDADLLKAEWQSFYDTEYKSYEPARAFSGMTYDSDRFIHRIDLRNETEYFYKAQATITDRIFTGSIGHAVASTADEANDAKQYINVSLSGVSRDDLADASAIRITNLPTGMQQETRWIDGTTIARIYVYGAPEKASADQVQVEIGEESTTLGVPITPEENPNTRFFITKGQQIKSVAVTAGLPGNLYEDSYFPKYSTYSVPEEAGYEITDFGWYEDAAEVTWDWFNEWTSFENTKCDIGSDAESGEVISGYSDLSAAYLVKAKSGYVFAPETELKATVNGSRVNVYTQRMSDSEIIVKKAYSSLGKADARYMLSFIDPEDAGNTWTETVKGNGTEFQLENYLTEPKGRELDHWNLRVGDSRSSNTVEYDKDAQIVVYANLVFEAVWKDRSYTVHFAAGNSQAGGTMADAITGVEYELPECGFTPPANRKFYKWKYNGELYDAGDTITIKDGFVKTTEITLTAVWQSDASDTAGVITIKNVVPPVDGNLPDETFGLMEGEHTHATTLAELTDVYKSRYPELSDAQNETMAQLEIENYSGWSKIDESGMTTYYYKYGQDYWPSGTGYVKDNKYRFMLYVTADSGYVFDSSDLSVVPEKLMENTDYDSAKTTFVTGSDNTIVKVELYFTAKKATMDVSFDANGGEGTMETVPVATGSEYTLPACTFTAPEGKEFDRWQIDSAFFEAGSKITVKEDLNLKAVWATDVAPSYIVKVTEDGLGTASASATEAKKGTVVTLTQTPNAGQTFKRWIVMSCPDGVDITVAADGTFTMPEGDVEIMACFHDHDYTENADAKYLKYPAGCTGKAVYYQSCSVCGIRGEETFEYGEPLGHTWVDPAGVQTIDPGCTEFGELTFTCSVCGMKETEKINPLGHDWNAAVYEWSADNSQVTASHICKRNAGHTETENVNTKVTGGTATCEAAGTADFEAEFVNPDFAKQTKTANVEALGHDWGEPSYVWNADNSQVTATRICKRDDSHKESETAEAVLIKTTATCETAGVSTYEALFKNDAFAKQTKTVDTAPLGHDWGDWEVVTPATETEPSIEKRTCKRNANHTETRQIPSLSANGLVAFFDDDALKGEVVTYNDSADAKRYEHVYTGAKITPVIVVQNNGTTLTEGTDYTVKYANNLNVSTISAEAKKNKPATVTITGKGSFTGKRVLEFYIMPKALDDGTYQNPAEGITVSEVIVAESAKAAPVVSYNGTVLKAKDYTVTSATNTDLKFTATDVNPTLTIAGKGNFTGRIENIPVTVKTKAQMKQTAVKAALAKGVSRIYTGLPQTLTVTTADTNGVTTQGELTVTALTAEGNTVILKEGTDFELNYSANVNAGTVKVTVSGKGAYTGSVTKSFKILPAKEPAELKAELVRESEEAQAGHYTFAKTGVTPKVTVTAKLHDAAANVDVTKTLTEGVDYKITYQNNKKVSTDKAKGAYKLTFLGNYKGAKLPVGADTGFTVDPADLSDAEVIVSDMIFNPKNKKAGKYLQTPAVTLNGILLAKNEYTVDYYAEDPKDPGTFKTEALGASEAFELSESDPVRNIAVVLTVNPKNANYKMSKPAMPATPSAVYAVRYDKNAGTPSAKTDISKAKIALETKAGGKVSKVFYTGKPITFNPEDESESVQNQAVLTVTIGNPKKGGVILKGAEVYKYFNVTYANNTAKGKATVILSAKQDDPGNSFINPYAGMRSGNFTIAASNVNTAMRIKNLVTGAIQSLMEKQGGGAGID